MGDSPQQVGLLLLIVQNDNWRRAIIIEINWGLFNIINVKSYAFQQCGIDAING